MDINDLLDSKEEQFSFCRSNVFCAFACLATAGVIYALAMSYPTSIPLQRGYSVVDTPTSVYGVYLSGAAGFGLGVIMIFVPYKEASEGRKYLGFSSIFSTIFLTAFLGWFVWNVVMLS